MIKNVDDLRTMFDLDDVVGAFFDDKTALKVENIMYNQLSDALQYLGTPITFRIRAFFGKKNHMNINVHCDAADDSNYIVEAMKLLKLRRKMETYEKRTED